MRKGVAFGTFSLLHPGHIHFIREARRHCGHLTVVVARDSTVERLKGKCLIPEQQRLEMVQELKDVDRAMLGHENGRYGILSELMPDVVILGPDQEEGESALKAELLRRGIHAEVVRIPRLTDGELHKSSRIAKRIRGH